MTVRGPQAHRDRAEALPGNKASEAAREVHRQALKEHNLSRRRAFLTVQFFSIGALKGTAIRSSSLQSAAFSASPVRM